MSGMRLALARAQRMEVSPGLFLLVATPECLLLMKIIAYLDRPGERDKDLMDMIGLFEDWLKPDDEERFVDGIEYDLAAPHALGRRLRGALDARERGSVADFLAMVRDSGHGAATQGRMMRRAPRHWNDDPDELLRRWQAFEDALELR